MKIAVVGPNGFVGKNLIQHLLNLEVEIVKIERETLNVAELLSGCEVIYYLAGVNRPKTNPIIEYMDHEDSVFDFCKIYEGLKTKPKLVYASSTQAELDNDYGRNKIKVEKYFKQFVPTSKLKIKRFTNIYGKWCKPNYNSFISTFIYNTVNNIDCKVSIDEVDLVYIDDVINNLINDEEMVIHSTTVDHVYNLIRSFKDGNRDLNHPLIKNLFSTYCSVLGPQKTEIKSYSDKRGSFATLYQYPDNTMVSANTINVGESKGGHWHHSKIEEFIVITGTVTLEFIDILNGSTKEIEVKPMEKIVMPPAMHHTIVNKGNTMAVFIIWTNELYDPQNSDTYGRKS